MKLGFFTTCRVAFLDSTNARAWGATGWLVRTTSKAFSDWSVATLNLIRPFTFAWHAVPSQSMWASLLVGRSVNEVIFFAIWTLFGAARGLYLPLLQLLIPALAPLSLSRKEMAGKSVFDPFSGDHSIRN